MTAAWVLEYYGLTGVGLPDADPPRAWKPAADTRRRSLLEFVAFFHSQAWPTYVDVSGAAPVYYRIRNRQTGESVTLTEILAWR